MRMRNALALLAPIALASWGLSPLFDILLGTDDLEGGDTELGHVSQSAIDQNGGTAIGVLKNETGLKVEDLTFEFEGDGRGSGGGSSPSSSKTGIRVTVGNDLADSTQSSDWQQKDFDSGTAHIDLSSVNSMPGSDAIQYRITGISDPGSFKVTPSGSLSIGGTSVEFNPLPGFELQRSNDLVRRGSGSHYHAALAAVVANRDASRGMVELDGLVTFPGPTTASLSAVHLFEVGGTAIPATITTNGNSFQISSTTIAAGTSAVVFLELTNGLDGSPVQLRLESSFAP